MAQLELPHSALGLVNATSMSLKAPLHTSLPLSLLSADHSSPSEDADTESSSEATTSSGSSSPAAADPSPSSAEDRDVHQLPTYSAAPPEPILYLPPLLSSLPQGLTHGARPALPRTPTTESCLPTIDSASLALHRALHHFQTVTREYATAPYDAAFNWDELVLDMPLEEEREWYCVAFRSKRKDGSDGGPLYEADKRAHEEAVQNGGLIMYWYGSPHPETGLNLATCIWQSRPHALAAHSRPHHLLAMRLAAVSYERYELERYRLFKFAGESALRILPFDGLARK